MGGGRRDRVSAAVGRTWRPRRGRHCGRNERAPDAGGGRARDGDWRLCRGAFVVVGSIALATRAGRVRRGRLSGGLRFLAVAGVLPCTDGCRLGRRGRGGSLVQALQLGERSRLQRAVHRRVELPLGEHGGGDPDGRQQRAQDQQRRQEEPALSPRDELIRCVRSGPRSRGFSRPRPKAHVRLARGGRTRRRAPFATGRCAAAPPACAGGSARTGRPRSSTRRARNPIRRQGSGGG